MKLSRFWVCLVVQVALVAWCAQASESVTDGPADQPTTVRARSSVVAAVRELLSTALDSASTSDVARKVLQAEVSAECSLGLLKLMRGLRNLEPWAFRRKFFLYILLSINLELKRHQVIPMHNKLV